jgi:hypothetical protein
MPTFHIIIKGVSLIYQNDDVWTAIFPFAGRKDCHTLKLEVPGKTDAMPLAVPDRELEVTANNPQRPADPQGAGLETFINLNSYYAHDGDLRLKSDWRQHSTFLRIYNAKLSVAELTHCRYSLNENQTVRKSLENIGYSARAEIVSESISIAARDKSIEPVTLSEDCEILFDNSCEGERSYGTGDIGLLYDYVCEDRVTSTRRLSVVRDPSQNPSGLATKGIEKILDNPMPNRIGLPCNIFLGGDGGRLS